MPTELALHGGPPVRPEMLPYGRQWVDEDDIAAVSRVLRSDWLTTGPSVGEFERALTEFTGAAESVVVSSGTAALHAAVYAAGIGEGDEVIVPTMTFAASANCVVYQGGTPVFADVRADTLLIDPGEVERLVTLRTRAVIAVDYAGQPCDYDALRTVTDRHGLVLIGDAAHSLGATSGGRPVGTLADLTTFSLHPVKHVTTGEGGAVTTHDPEMARRMRVFRNHGITSDHRQREAMGSWYYEMVDLGYNYRITDFQCALGLSQLGKLRGWVKRRQEIAQRYDEVLSDIPGLSPLRVRSGASHAHHLYVVQWDPRHLRAARDTVFSALRAEGIGVNVHYIPVHLHPYYRGRFGTVAGMCPVAEAAYERLLSLPIFPRMSERDVEDVLAAVTKVAHAFAA